MPSSEDSPSYRTYILLGTSSYPFTQCSSIIFLYRLKHGPNRLVRPSFWFCIRHIPHWFWCYKISHAKNSLALEMLGDLRNSIACTTAFQYYNLVHFWTFVEVWMWADLAKTYSILNYNKNFLFAVLIIERSEHQKALGLLAYLWF